MKSNKDLILILGTGYMASVYFSHFKFLKENCYMVYRNKNSQNYINAQNRFGEEYLISKEESINLNPKILLSCVNPESHLNLIEPFMSKNCLIAVEKPPSLDMELISNYLSKKKINVLMNRRYYYWVNDICLKAKKFLIRKIVVNIPEQFCDESWYGIPKNIATNSIHIFDLVSFICKGLNKPEFSKIKNNSAFVFTSSQLVEEVVFQMNYDAFEKFSIKFYLKDNSLIECSPIEEAYHYEEFKIEEPTKDSFIRKYIPIKNKIPTPKNQMFYQKPGVLELCKDLIIASKHEKVDELSLPDLNETFNIMSWMKNSLSK